VIEVVDIFANQNDRVAIAWWRGRQGRRFYFRIDHQKDFLPNAALSSKRALGPARTLGFEASFDFGGQDLLV
jgi:hypothetical protein